MLPKTAMKKNFSKMVIKITDKHLPTQIEKAIARLPKQSNASIEQTRLNALRQKIDELVAACQAELRSRGSLNLNTADAEEAAKICARVSGKQLTEVIKIAFEEIPPKQEEVLILKKIFNCPGTSYVELLKIYGKKDLSLVIGHLVYYRFGYFREFLSSPVQSDIILDRTNSAKGVYYTLRQEASEAFQNLDLLRQ